MGTSGTIEPNGRGSSGAASVATAGDVLDFWFGMGEARGKARPEWYRKDRAFDEKIRRGFGALLESAARRELEAWRAAPASMVALVVVLDQFSRNLFRDDPRAFAQDAYARECAREALARGDEAVLLPVERQFLYMPFEHAESLADQELSLDRIASLEAFPETRGLLEYARRHEAIVRRFGRFPHRNAALGRTSTPEEVEFLKQPGSGF
jgi:uncharacterized protein (DUF924 family)